MRIFLAFLLASFVIEANAASLYAGGTGDIRVYDPSTGTLQSSWNAPNEDDGRGFAFGPDGLL